MSWTSPCTVASTIVALAGRRRLFHERFEVGHGRLHHLGRLQHERQLHLARAEQIADRLHAVEQDVVDDRQRRALGHGLVQVGLEPVALTVDDASFQSFADVAALRVPRADAAEDWAVPPSNSCRYFCNGS